MRRRSMDRLTLCRTRGINSFFSRTVSHLAFFYAGSLKTALFESIWYQCMKQLSLPFSLMIVCSISVDCSLSVELIEFCIFVVSSKIIKYLIIKNTYLYVRKYI